MEVAFIIFFVALVALAVVLAVNPWGTRTALRQALPDVAEAFGADERTVARLRAPADPGVQPLPLRAWLDRVNRQPDRTPHLCVTGPSGSGKTTLVLAALDDRPGHLVICTPKHADDDPWGGFPAVRPRVGGGRFDFSGIAAAAQAVYNEMLRRNVEGARDAAWLTLVIDDYGILIGKIPELSGWVLDMVALGRSVRVRVVLLSIETNVKAWGWEGRSEARASCLFIECEEETHRAVMFRWGKERQAIDTTLLDDLARRARLAGRAWPGTPAPGPGPAPERPVSIVSVPPVSPAGRERRVGYAAVRAEDNDALLARMVGVAVVEDQSARALWSESAPNLPAEQAEHRSGEHQSRGAEQFDLRTERGLIAFLVSQGLSANEIVARLKGDNNRLYKIVAEEVARQNA